MKPVCIMCGKSEGAKEHKLPHGAITLCPKKECLDLLLAITEESVPLVWIGRQDLEEHEVIKEGTEINPSELSHVVNEMGGMLWNGLFGEIFENCVKRVGKILEQWRILNAPAEDLPLMIGELLHEENKSVLEKRMREECITESE